MRTFRTYGRKYDRRKFKEVSEPSSFLEPKYKPVGGWWACPIETNEWYRITSKWSQEKRDFWEIQIDFYTEFSVNEDSILIIDTWEFLKELISNSEKYGWKRVIEVLKSLEVQAILVTRKCMNEWNSHYNPEKDEWEGYENTWDIESLFVFDPDCICDIKYVSKEKEIA